MASYGVRTHSGAPTNGTNAQQTITVTGSPAGGNYRLKYGSQLTAQIAHDAAAATVQSALRALSRIGSTGVTVTGSAGGPYTVDFTGALAAYDVLPLQLATNSLTGGTNPSVSIAETINGVTATSRGAPEGAELVDTSTGDRYVNRGSTTEPSWIKSINSLAPAPNIPAIDTPSGDAETTVNAILDLLVDLGLMEAES